MPNPKTHTCECGHTWNHGQHGGHSCSEYYQATIAKLKNNQAPVAPQPNYISCDCGTVLDVDKLMFFPKQMHWDDGEINWRYAMMHDDVLVAKTECPVCHIDIPQPSETPS